ncbi:MAG TPA: carbon-nitrogen hydrolase family protein, partial [Gemmatimonadales bacterium]|nr:carbon-nitrogen hydrolase family protein [Gemmatimonadales bacterium]
GAAAVPRARRPGAGLVVRVTVCELPHEPDALATAWAGLRQHTSRHRSELVLLPEFAMVEPVWEEERFDQARWAAALARSDAWLQRLPELGAARVVGARPVTIEGRPFNQGYLWSPAGGLTPLRRKFFLPDEPGNWEARWFDRGDPAFPAFRAGDLTFGLNICTELWALETYGAYVEQGVQVILSPRATAAATAAKWLSVGVVAAVRAGAFSVSSNRVDPTGACGGMGWIISPQGQILAATSPEAPYATMDIDLGASTAARAGYPRYVFRGEGERPE